MCANPIQKNSTTDLLLLYLYRQRSVKQATSENGRFFSADNIYTVTDINLGNSTSFPTDSVCIVTDMRLGQVRRHTTVESSALHR